MKPMKSVNVKKSPFLPATESYCELLGYQKIYLWGTPDLVWPQWWSFADVSQQGLDFSKKKSVKEKYFFGLIFTDVHKDRQKLGPILESKSWGFLLRQLCNRQLFSQKFNCWLYIFTLFFMSFQMGFFKQSAISAFFILFSY